ncbi:MAG: SLC13 family permease [Blastochloris sp.]|nr:SLC13 family permease [Blastochloris sp.]
MQQSKVRPFGKLTIPSLERKTVIAIVLAVVSVLGIAALPAGLSTAGKIALGVFALTVIGWTLTKLNDTFVALFAAGGLVISATISTENFFASLGNSVVWLMIGAFIVASALNKSGVSARLTALAARRARTVEQLFYLLTAVLLGTALLIPSTSARAALMVPVYTAMAAAFNDPRINRTLAIMLPVNILQTAVASLVGAGAHLVINDTLGQLTGRPLSFITWIVMGLPFAALSAFGTTWVILRLFLDPERRKLPLAGGALSGLPQPGPIGRSERYIIGVTAALVLLWATESLHGIDNALVAIFGALAVTVPTFGVLKFKDAAKGVEWEMIIFVAATLSLSEALVASGAGKWLVDTLLINSGIAGLGSSMLVLLGVILITVTSHLYITSRSARGAGDRAADRVARLQQRPRPTDPRVHYCGRDRLLHYAGCERQTADHVPADRRRRQPDLRRRRPVPAQRLACAGAYRVAAALWPVLLAALRLRQADGRRRSADAHC